ncbi:sensor protein PilS [Sinobacterium caligoides]|uniref:histidine kinase n=1 Tax=Sinobacterium caligoides TaxID=933926 RepID=A0A3N2D4P2_9GAMM|nr:ATP-binding protein [Sinobacterium caligoides]ROR94739.1 sensor protein PilS [Sinobacterium caligoides]
MLSPDTERLFFRNYTFYRIFLCLCLLTMFFIELEPKIIGNLYPNLFALSIISYGAVCLANLIMLGITLSTKQVRGTLLLCFIIDITVISLLCYASGTAGNALSLLLIIIIASGAISMGPTISLLLAAIATIAVLTRSGYQYLELGNGYSHLLLSAAVQGVIFFLASILVQRLAYRILKSEELASEQASTLADLQHLNQLIVQRMQTGVIVATKQHKIRLINKAAQRLLGGNKTMLSTATQQLPNLLADKYDRWLNDPQQHSLLFEPYASGPKIRVNFAPLSPNNEHESIIFLEDDRLLVQQAQQIKLSSLGRLTASIAHEIRNPLGAISHAAQLLKESEQLDSADLKLSNIVQNNCLRMNDIIENVLSISRRGETRPEQLSMTNYLREFKEQFLHSQPASQVTLELEHDIHINFDPGQLNQVLINLCENAIRYSQQVSGEQSVIIRGYTDENNKLPQIDIVDFGAGIAEDKIDTVFEPFYTTESTGSGLGLYLCREMCEANHTLLHYQRDQRGRSCFKLTFSHPMKRWPTS